MQAWRSSSEVNASQRIRHLHMLFRQANLSLQRLKIGIDHCWLRLQAHCMDWKATEVALLLAKGQMKVHVLDE